MNEKYFYLCFWIFEFLLSILPWLSINDSLNKTYVLYVFFVKPTLTEITFPCFCFWFKFIKKLSVFIFSVLIRPKKPCLIRHCFCTIFVGFPIFCKNLSNYFRFWVCCSKIEKENPLFVVLYNLQFFILLSLRLANSFDEL